jgi:hypothetical protein
MKFKFKNYINLNMVLYLISSGLYNDLLKYLYNKNKMEKNLIKKELNFENKNEVNYKKFHTIKII